MTNDLIQRSQSACECCGNTENLTAFTISPKAGEDASEQVAVCGTCLAQINGEMDLDENHWRCLNDSVWNPEPAVQVLSYRMLKRLDKAGWAQDLLGMMYMDEDTREWAEMEEESAIVHKDSNGNVLQNGDTVTLIKDLNVKGASFTAKRGTAVRRIRLVPDNAGQIEGKVDGQQIVILTQFVKK